MEPKITRLHAEDYDALLRMLNEAFHEPPGRTFDLMLPAMWERDEDHMSKHVAVKENGRVLASVGIYPFRVVIGEKVLTFATIGNVATLPESQGKGYMTALLKTAVDEARKMGVDVARLGGLRQRYNRFGFENAGTSYQYTLTSRNLREYYDGTLSDGAYFEQTMTFRRVTMETKGLLEFCFRLHQQAPMYVDRRNLKRFFKTLSAWKSEVWVAFSETGSPIGYLCATPDRKEVSEHRGLSAELEYRMLCQWIGFAGVEEIHFSAAPWEVELNTAAGKICENWTVGITSHYLPFHWCELMNALLDLKSSYSVIPDECFTLEIEGYGVLAFVGANCSVVGTEGEREVDMKLNHLDAVRFLIGCLPAVSVFDVPEKCRRYVSQVFPLPLWWCGQDRV